MSDETVTETDETIDVSEPTAEPTPVALNDEAVAEYLGVDPEYFVENKKKFTDLQGLYKKLNTERMKQAAQEKEMPYQAPTPDEDVSLDAASRKILDAYFAEKMAPIATMQQATLADAFSETIDTFVEAHPDDDHDAIASLMEELYPPAKTPAQLKKNMERARRVWVAEQSDPSAEAERIAAEKLESVKSKGEVVEVKSKAKGSTKPRDVNDILEDSSIPWYEKFAQVVGGE